MPRNSKQNELFHVLVPTVRALSPERGALLLVCWALEARAMCNPPATGPRRPNLYSPPRGREKRARTRSLTLARTAMKP